MIHLSPNKINGSIRRKTQKNGYEAKQTMRINGKNRDYSYYYRLHLIS